MLLAYSITLYVKTCCTELLLTMMAVVDIARTAVVLDSMIRRTLIMMLNVRLVMQLR